MSEANKMVARRFVEGISQGNMDVFDELVAPDFVDRTPLPGADSTREGWKQAYTNQERDPFPDLRFKIVDEIAEGDRVVIRSEGRGTPGQMDGHPGHE